MYVGGVMQTNLVTISPEASLVEARDIISEKQIAHLLVVDKTGKLIGMVSDRDLKQSWASPATTLSNHELSYLLEKLTIKMIMVKKIITVSPATTIERAAQIMQTQRIGSLPVMDDQKLVGIITTNDVMGVLLHAIGIDRESTRMSVLAEDRIGYLAELTQTLKEQQINIRSVFSWPEKQFPEIHRLVFRVPAVDGERAAHALKENGFKVITEYHSDLTPFLPDR